MAGKVHPGVPFDKAQIEAIRQTELANELRQAAGRIAVRRLDGGETHIASKGLATS